jgi:glutaredoxin 2
MADFSPRMQLSKIKVLKKSSEKAATEEARKKFMNKYEKSILNFIDEATAEELENLEKII